MGNLTSQLFANIYIKKFVKRMKRFNKLLAANAIPKAVPAFIFYSQAFT